MVQAGAGAVVAHGGARVGVGGGFLHVAERYPCVEGGGDERVPQGVRAYLLGDSRAAGDPADDAGGAVPVQPLPVGGEEQRARGPLADGQVDGPGGTWGERDGDDLPALAGDDQGPVTAFLAQVLDVRAGGLGHTEPVEGQQGDEGMLGRGPRPAATRSAPTSLRSRAVACDS
jgi:hypothetical protein